MKKKNTEKPLTEETTILVEPGTYRVNSEGGVNLRAMEGYGARIIRVMPDGTEVECDGQYKVSEADGTIWIHVSVGDTEGYCVKDYLNKV